MNTNGHIKIYKNWCKKCGICIAFCHKKALEVDQDGYPHINGNQSCDGCGLCELRCPDFAIVVEHEKSRVAAGK